ncbi:MAG TPA: ABC transporter substrate-binding protein [Pseudogracilibacillus sp.]|nr:ABC transporter substrate-binding protein [Pseudogracilibacillus sp.]
MRRSLVMFMFLIAFILATGCQASQNNEEVQTNEDEVETDSFPVTVQIDDEEITIEEKPSRIFPLSLEVAEIVLDLVEPEKIVAATNGIDDPLLSTKVDVAEKIEGRIGAQVNIDPEEIISYDTDLLLLTKMFGEQEEAENTLKQLDTPILSFDSIVTTEQYLDVTRTIGKAVGEESKAEELIASIEEKINSLQQQIPEEESPSVLILSEIGGDLGPFMMGPTNISYDLLKLAGATPAVDTIELERSAPASIEQVLKTDPDYILLVDFFGKGEEGFNELMNDPGWNTLKAVEEGNIKLIEAKYIVNPNSKNVDGLEMLIDWLYNE